MTTKKTLTAALLLLALPLSAQDIYKMEMFSGNDLNGTARFVGMGGAMSALGADLSTMTTNPAATGLYRRSDIAVSASVLSQPNAEDFYGIDKTRLSFDQAGFVYAMPVGDEVRYVNFGFNYQKRRNLKNYIGVNNFATGGLSQTQQMMDLAYTSNGWLDLSNENDRAYTTPLTVAGYETYLLDGDATNGYSPLSASRYNYQRVQYGGVHEFDFNVSMNWNDQVYVGLTFGIYDVDIHSKTFYTEESLYSTTGNSFTDRYGVNNLEELTGTGYDMKLGVIFRPIEDSPFRVGVAVHTPIFFDLTSRYDLNVASTFSSTDASSTEADKNYSYSISDGQDYKIRTPWKFSLSAATTIGKSVALDAEYEYRDYGATRVRYPRYNSWWEDSWSDSENDQGLEQEAKKYLKGVSTFRIGAEWRVVPGAYLRLGYNYESSPFDKKAFLNEFAEGSSYYYSSGTDYANLSAINRVTAGFGVRGKHWYADFAYQYQHQTANFYAFHVPTENVYDNETNALSAAKVDLNRHQAMLTIGYKF